MFSMMPSLSDPYGVFTDVKDDPVCETCGHELAGDIDIVKLEVSCPRCRQNTVKCVSPRHCERCRCELVWNDDIFRYVCPQCGKAAERGPCPYLREEWKIMTACQHDPLKYFRSWVIHILGWEPSSELGDSVTLLKKLEGLKTRDKVSAPSVKDCRRWLKELGQTKLYRNTTQILIRLTKAQHPTIDVGVVKVAEVKFRSLLQLQQTINFGGSRSYPFYIYKILDEILQGEHRWVLSYIHLPSEKTLEKCEVEWKMVLDEKKLSTHSQRARAL